MPSSLSPPLHPLPSLNRVLASPERTGVRLTMSLPERVVDFFHVSSTGFSVTTDRQVTPGATANLQFAIGNELATTLPAVATYSRRSSLRFAPNCYRSSWAFEIGEYTSQVVGRLIAAIDTCLLK